MTTDWTKEEFDEVRERADITLLSPVNYGGRAQVVKLDGEHYFALPSDPDRWSVSGYPISKELAEMLIAKFDRDWETK